MLIVDDDPDIVEAISLALALRSVSSCSTDAAERAVELSRQESPCLTLLDYRLAGVDVPRLVSALRRASSGLIALCTAADDPWALAELTGADLVLSKPFTLEALFDLVRQAEARLERPNV